MVITNSGSLQTRSYIDDIGVGNSFFNYTYGPATNSDFFFIYAAYNPTNWTLKINRTYFTNIKLDGSTFSGDTWTLSYYATGTYTWTATIRIQKY